MPVAAKSPPVSAPLELSAQGEWCGIEWIDKHAEQWKSLCAEGPCNQPFFRPEWIASYLRAFAPGRPVLMVTVWNRGRLRAVLPLLKQRAFAWGLPFTKLHGAANVHSCRFDVIHGAGADAGPAVRAVWRYLKALPDWDMIELPDVPAGGAGEQLLKAAADEGFPSCRCESVWSPFVDLRGQNPSAGFSQFGRKSHFRHSLRRWQRRMEENGGPLSLRKVRLADPNSLEQFYQLEKSGWKGRKATAIACGKEERSFYDLIAKSAADSGYLALYFLDQGNNTVAAHFGLAYQQRYYPLKIAYDESLSKCAPGHLMLGTVLEDCVRQGILEFDFLGQWQEWKAEWAAESLPHAHCYVFRKTLTGRILQAITQQEHRLWMSVRKYGHRLVNAKLSCIAKWGNVRAKFRARGSK